jgi:hypothetical protein
LQSKLSTCTVRRSNSPASTPLTKPYIGKPSKSFGSSGAGHMKRASSSPFPTRKHVGL